MGRPKANPRMRFMNEIDIWAKAYMAYQANGQELVITMPSPNAAIALNHKLNMARATIRATEGNDGWHEWDVLAVRRKECRIILGLKQDTFDQIVSIETSGGTVLHPDEIRSAKWQYDEKNRLAMEGFHRTRQATPSVNEPKIDGQGRLIRGNEDVPDPTKPLID